MIGYSIYVISAEDKYWTQYFLYIHVYIQSFFSNADYIPD